MMDLQLLTRRYLDENGWSIRFMSGKTGLTKNEISKWLRYEKRFNTEKLEKVKKFLGGNSVVKAADIATEVLINEQKSG